MSESFRSPGRDLFTSQLPLIEKVIEAVVRRHRLSYADAEDFKSITRLRLLERDCAVLRRFEGRSSLTTFLTVVVNRFCLDYRRFSWGNWRPSATARRLGSLATSLEQLVVRDRLSIDEACRAVRADHERPAGGAELDGLRARLPLRHKRRIVDDAELASRPAPGPSPETALLEGDVRPTIRALAGALLRLPPDERRIIRLRFAERLTVAEIARLDGIDQRALYRRLQRMLLTLRHNLEEQGISRSDVSAASLAHHTLAWSSIASVSARPPAPPTGRAARGKNHPTIVRQPLTADRGARTFSALVLYHAADRRSLKSRPISGNEVEKCTHRSQPS